MSENPTSTHTKDPPGERKHVGGDLIIPVAGIAFAFYYFSTIIESPWTAQVSAVFVGSVLIVLVLMLLIKTTLLVSRGEADLRLDNLVAPRAFVPKRLILFALTIGYIVAVHYAGFTLTTFAFLAAAMLTLTDGRKIRFVLLLSAITAIAGWALFILAFRTRFPDGPFERLMERLL